MMTINTDELLEQRRKLAREYPELRDSFAMAALSGLVTTKEPKEAVSVAYQIADAMLAERQKKT